MELSLLAGVQIGRRTAVKRVLSLIGRLSRVSTPTWNDTRWGGKRPIFWERAKTFNTEGTGLHRGRGRKVGGEKPLTAKGAKGSRRTQRRAVTSRGERAGDWGLCRPDSVFLILSFPGTYVRG